MISAGCTRHTWDEGRRCLGRLPAYTLEQVRVGVGGDGHRRVTQPLADDRQVDPGRDLQRRSTVAQVVQALARQAGAGRELLHVPRDVLGSQVAAVLLGEDEVVRAAAAVAVGQEPSSWQRDPVRVLEEGASPVLPGRRPRLALLRLPQLVLEQRSNSVPVDVDLAVTAGRLRLVEDAGAAEVDDLLSDVHDASGEVDVAPAQTDRLAAAKAGEGDELVHRPEPVGARRVEERSELLDLPGLHLRSL